jgi:hypothetical protein
MFLSREFLGLRYRRVEALSAFSRAVLNHDLDAATYRRYGSARLPWAQIVRAILQGQVFGRQAAAICSSRRPGYYFDNSVRPLQTATGPGFRGSAAQLQAALDAEAGSGGGTVWLARAAVIYVDRRMPVGKLIRVPAGVQLATIGQPGPRSYEKMARLVRVGNGCLVGLACDQPVLEVDAAADTAKPGGRVQGVWIDGGGGNMVASALAGSAVQLKSGANAAIMDSRIGGAIPRARGGGVTLGLQGSGNDPSRPCVQMRAIGNLITAYSTDHFLSWRWADGITIDCEDARVEGNTIVDPSDAGIALFGNHGVDQHSLVDENYILSAGNDAFSALDVDPHGVCPGCHERVLRNFGGALLEDNTFISGPRTGFGFGINLGIRPLYNSLPDGTGITAIDNGTGRGSARVNVGLVISGMFNATVLGDMGQLILVHINSCPMIKSAAARAAGLASFTMPPQPYADAALILCWTTPHHKSNTR